MDAFIPDKTRPAPATDALKRLSENEMLASELGAIAARRPAAAALKAHLESGAPDEGPYTIGLALSGGGIRIAEAGFAKVSVHIYANSLPAGDALEVDIRKNGTTFWQYSAEDSDSTYVVFDLVSRLIPVAANDVITMAVRNWQYVRGKIVPESTYMTVDLYKNLNF